MRKFCIILLSVPCILAHIHVQGRKHRHPLEENVDRPSEPGIGPKGMPYNKTTDCETFGQFGRFNPHSVVGVRWFVFYYWSKPQKTRLYRFWIPGKKDMQLLHYALDGHLPKHFDWSGTLVLRRNLLTNRTKLLERKGDRGQYIIYSIYRKIPKGTITDYRKIRIKQTSDNKYLGIMDCKSHMARVMCHLESVPAQAALQAEASRMGVRGRRGKSYLYQGHEWMPVPELSEAEFWYYNRGLKKLQ